MSRTTREIVEQLDTVDETGQLVRVLVIQGFTEARTLNDHIQRIAGAKEYRTEHGGPVNVQADGTLYDLRGHRILRRTK